MSFWKRDAGLPAALAVLVALAAFHLSSFAGVPFHPDEATQLYMSSDFDALVTRPASLAWTPDRRDDPQLIIRLLDAPLTRYTLGVGRALAGLSAPPVDWDWGLTWAENEAAGALPSERLLVAGRLAVTLLLPLSVTFIYLSGRAAGGWVAGVVAALLLGTNALVLVHSRRAMAEGALTFGVTLALWGCLRGDRRPWLAGLGVALAFNAKQSALALFPVGLLAVVWLPADASRRRRRLATHLLQYMAVFGLLTLALNPVLWRDPVRAAGEMWRARGELLARQVADAERLAPGQVLDTPVQRLGVMAANLFYLPPAFYEVDNYAEDTAAAEEAYLRNPAHHLLRGLAGGTLMLVLTLFGLIAAALQWRRESAPQRRVLTLLLLATLLQTALLVAAVPLPWQRFVMPLVPMACLWAGYGVSRLFASATRSTRQGDA